MLHLHVVKERLAMMPSEVPSQQHLWLLGVTVQCPGQQVGVGAEPHTAPYSFL